METIVKARKIHKCEVCSGNIQKGEKYINKRERYPEFDNEYIQIGVFYYAAKMHNKDCFPRLLHFENTKEVLKNCNYGIHSACRSFGPDDYGPDHCKWCGIELQ